MSRGRTVLAGILGTLTLMTAATSVRAIDDLTLNVAPASTCVSIGSTVTVTLDATNLSAAVNGVQVLLQYDPTLMTLVSIVPTDLGLTLPAAGWVTVSQTDVAGAVTWAGVINGGSILINHTIATLTFTALANGTAGVSFRPDAPPIINKLTRASDSATLTPLTTGSGGVFIGPPVCTITADAAVCLGTPGHVASVPSAGVGATYAWTVTGGTIISGLGTPSITYTAGTGASLTIDVTVTDGNGCSSSCTNIVPINPNPVCTITAAASVCANSTGNPASVPDAGIGATYAWTVTGGTLVTGLGTSAITFSAGAGPSVTLDITVTDANGCTSTCQTVIAVAAPDCTITAEAAVCAGSAGHIVSVPSAGVGATYTWTVTGGTIVGVPPFSNSITYTAGVGATVTIDVTVVGSAGCQSTCQKIVTVNANPNATISTAAAVCDGSTLNAASVLDAGVGATYAWTVTGGTLESVAPLGAAITYTAGVGPTVTLDVTVTDANGCVGTSQTIVTVNANPNATISTAAAVCDGSIGNAASVLSAGVGATYAWTITGGTLESVAPLTNAITYTAGVGPTVTIDVTVTDPNGCVSSSQTIVTVNPNPVCTITAAAAVCDSSTGNAASVLDAGVGATYAWTITGGTLESVAPLTNAITYTAGIGPTVTIDVTVTDPNGCVSSCQQVVTVAANPVCTLTGANAVCNGSLGNIVTTTDLGVGATYAWTVTGGTITLGQNTPSLTYTAGVGPTITIDLTVTDAGGCVSTCQKIVTVNANPNATISTAAAVCDGSTLNAASVLDAGLGATYAWTVTGGTLESVAPLGAAITYTAGVGPSVTLDVTVTDANGCVGTSQTIVTVNANPNATISTAAAVCDGSTLNAASVLDAGIGATYAWTVTGGTIDGLPPFGNAITYTAGVGPTVTIDVTVTDPNGCVSSSQSIVTVNPNPLCAITTAAAVCAGSTGLTAFVTDAGVGATYAWTVTGGTLTTGQGTTAVTFSAGAGPTLTLDVIVTDVNGCVTSCQQIVTVNPNPACTITANSLVCATSSGNLASVPSAGAGATYAWTITGGTLDSIPPLTNSISYTAGTGTSLTISVTVTDANGCVSTCNKVVTVDAPDCTISGAASVCFNSVGNFATTIDAGVGSTYLWTVTGGGTLQTGQATNSITYTSGVGTSVTLGVTVTNPNGCSKTCSKVVTVIQPSLDVTLTAQGINTAVTRNVTFVVTECLGLTDTRVLPVSFDITGLGTVIVPNTSPNANFVGVREGHTLQRSAAITYGTCSVATITMTGATQLLTGDFQTATVPQDNLCDITDFSILASRWNASILPTLATGGDATGDGVQGSADFTAIQANFFTLGQAAASCVLGVVDGGLTRVGPAPVVVSTRSTARTQVKVGDLTFSGADRADVNGDGVVDATDIRLFARQKGLWLTPRFERTLQKMEARPGLSKRGR